MILEGRILGVAAAVAGRHPASLPVREPRYTRRKPPPSVGVTAVTRRPPGSVGSPIRPAPGFSRSRSGRPPVQSGSRSADSVGMRVHRHGSGFTLLELIFVVVIVGLLATISIPLFMAYQLRSKSAEAKSNLGAVAVAEKAYYSEAGLFLAANPEPVAIPGPQAVPFDAVTSDFADLGFAPEGSVYFSYGVATSPDGSGYTADAGADIDANGIVQFWGFAQPDSTGTLVAGLVGCNTVGLAPGVIGPCVPAAGQSIF